MKIQFFLPMEKVPTMTHQQHKISTRGSRPILYKPQELKEIESMFISKLGPYAPKEKMEGAISLFVMWLFPTKDVDLDGHLKETKPDTDNLDKMLKDCMSKVGFWKDDAQVAIEHIEKRYALNSGIFIRVEKVLNEDICPC